MTTTTTRRLAACSVVALAISLLTGCATHPAGPIAAKDLAGAKNFGLFTVYWAGRSFDGVPLTAADTRRDYDATAGERVYYGNCDKQSVLSTVGCRLPLEIATVAFNAIDSRRNAGLGTRTNTTIRGVPAVIFNGGRSIQLYTEKLAIDIYADTPARALAAARTVTPMNRRGPQRAGTLRPPVFGKDVDPRLRAIERQLTAVHAAAAGRSVRARRSRSRSRSRAAGAGGTASSLGPTAGVVGGTSAGGVGGTSAGAGVTSAGAGSGVPATRTSPSSGRPPASPQQSKAD